MSWQALLAAHLVLTAAFALIYRRMASNLKGFGRIVTAVMYIGVILPGGIAVALWQGDISFGFSLFSWALIALVGILFTLTNLLSYKANEELDAAQFAVIGNLQALFVIAIAGIFLGERLSGAQLMGALLLVIAAADVAAEKVGARTFRLKKASLVAIASSLFVAAAITTEKAILNEVSFSTYLIVGWGAQSFVMGIFALRDRKLVHIPIGNWFPAPTRALSGQNRPVTRQCSYGYTSSRRNGFDSKIITGQERKPISDRYTISRRQLFEMLILGFLRLGQGLTFIAALTLTEASIAASVRGYKPILVFIAALIFLGEKRDFRRRAIGAVLATIGLLLLV